ncbi:hypothetical protein S7711_11374, partial [Stachybotrys chartarum IBT 7711]
SSIATAELLNYYHKHRGIVLGLQQSTSYLGGIFWVWILNQSIPQLGIRVAQIKLAAICAASLLPACIFLDRSPGVGHKHPAFRPLQNRIPLKETIKYVWSLVRQRLRTISWKYQLPVAVLHCAMVLIHIGTLIFCFFLIPAALNRLDDGGVGTMIVAVCQGGEFLGRWAIFYLGDRWGKYVCSSQRCFNTLSAFAASTAGMIALFTRAKTSVSCVTATFLFGFSQGGLLVLGAACLSEMPDAAPGDRIDALAVAYSVGTFLLPPISARLMLLGERFEPLLWVACGAVSIGSVVVFLLSFWVEWQ